MHYHAVGNRCAIDFSDIELSISVDRCLVVLKKNGFQELDVDLIKLARECVGVSKYKRAARSCEAPEIFDCSSFIKWLYGQRGIWLPRRSIQQREFGIQIDQNPVIAGDIIFVSGLINYYVDNPSDGVGHVGIATGENTVIHAANKKVGIIESSFEDFTRDRLRGIKRLIPLDRKVYTFTTPLEREVEWSDDIRWIILQNLTSQ